MLSQKNLATLQVYIHPNKWLKSYLYQIIYPGAHLTITHATTCRADSLDLFHRDVRIPYTRVASHAPTPATSRTTSIKRVYKLISPCIDAATTITSSTTFKAPNNWIFVSFSALMASQSTSVTRRFTWRISASVRMNLECNIKLIIAEAINGWPGKSSEETKYPRFSVAIIYSHDYSIY